MHVPDAVLSPAMSVATGTLALAGLAVGLRKLRDQLGERTVPLMGTMAAFVFAAQMVNFPLVPRPISGHLLGGVPMAVAMFLAPLASEHPDRLEWVGHRLGFLGEGESLFPAPIAEYTLAVPGLRHAKVATAAAGVVGTLVVFGLGFGFAHVFAARVRVLSTPESS